MSKGPGTPYSKAWAEYITSPDAIKTLKAGGDVSVYAENRLRHAFDAGWNAALSSVPATEHER